ncbi:MULTISPECIES: nucleotidyl transferase AbiEii/AbiGii toxin family protein [unclassified Pseudonocardia]|uniref:nucleotidyl transferase AbiEii/AbiGii toxin family protein n=1 Tax=unclassified Pseudonocardia TaxID=2619320 RepID=UPI00076118DB|nr:MULTISPECIES: nucleotidyl transferase AbiEii/AbiGii toxin family protein [unclassified Pseudonocardia]
MSLGPLQNIIATTALALPEARTLALAGGGAMIAHGYTERSTHDIDLFTEIDDDEAVRIAVALRLALRHRGIEIRDAAEPRDHRFIAVAADGRTECLVEIFADGGRLRPRVALDIGAVLHPEDLAADKVLALWARARPRDYHDVAALIERFGYDRLLELAAEKDAGWAEDGIEPGSIAGLVQLFEQWNTELRNASP